MHNLSVEKRLEIHCVIVEGLRDSFALDYLMHGSLNEVGPVSCPYIVHCSVARGVEAHARTH